MFQRCMSSVRLTVMLQKYFRSWDAPGVQIEMTVLFVYSSGLVMFASILTVVSSGSVLLR